MKSFQTIAIEATPKDYYVVAEIADCSPKNVQMVVKRLRGDNFNIQKIFTEFLSVKEALKQYRRKKEKPKHGDQ
ncbi:MAG: hypothetical protein ACOYXT_12645 [Bacteroidota bacterium]